MVVGSDGELVVSKKCLNCNKDISGSIPDYCNMACAIEKFYKQSSQG